MIAKKLSKEFMTKFTDKYKATCCRVLSRGFEMGSPERKQHCSNMVYDSCEILENLLIENEIVKN